MARRGKASPEQRRQRKRRSEIRAAVKPTEVEQAHTATGAVQQINLKEWRTDRLGRMKQRPEYQGLPSPVRSLVDYIVRRREHPDHDCFESQARIAKAKKLSRKTVNEYFRMAVNAGVLTTEKRYRGIGTKGGRSTNVYRLNESLIYGSGSGIGDSTRDSSGYTTGYSGSVRRTHVEPLSTKREDIEAGMVEEEQSVSLEARLTTTAIGPKNRPDRRTSESTIQAKPRRKVKNWGTGEWHDEEDVSW